MTGRYLALALAAVATALPLAVTPVPVAAQSYEFRQCVEAIDTDAVAGRQQLRCAAHELGSSGRELNRTFQSLLIRTRPSDRHALRVRQRAWISERRATCAPERIEANAPADYNRLLCLIRETDAQTARLRGQL